jgi:hypothetical protein
VISWCGRIVYVLCMSVPLWGEQAVTWGLRIKQEPSAEVLPQRCVTASRRSATHAACRGKQLSSVLERLCPGRLPPCTAVGLELEESSDSGGTELYDVNDSKITSNCEKLAEHDPTR